MKSFKFLAVVTFLTFFTISSKAGDVPTESKPELSQIKTMIQKINFDGIIDESTTVKLRFIINSKNELVVISTDNVDLDIAIKNALSYKKIKMSNLKHNEIYTLPITIQ